MHKRAVGGVSRALAFTRRAWRDTSGGAAVEFAFLAPLLALMLLGTIEGGRAVDIDRHFTSAVTTSGDLVAREAYLGESKSGAEVNLNAMMASIAQMMAPYKSDNLSLGIISVQASPTDASDTKVVWSYSYENKMSVPGKCAAYALPPNLIPKGGSIIVVQAKYKFTPLFGTYVPGFGSLGELEEKSYYSPRNSCVDYVKGDNCTNSC